MLTGKYYTEGDTELLHTYISEKITNEKPLPCYIYANFGEGFNLLAPVFLSPINTQKQQKIHAMPTTAKEYLNKCGLSEIYAVYIT